MLKRAVVGCILQYFIDLRQTSTAWRVSTQSRSTQFTEVLLKWPERQEACTQTKIKIYPRNLWYRNTFIYLMLKRAVVHYISSQTQGRTCSRFPAWQVWTQKSFCRIHASPIKMSRETKERCVVCTGIPSLISKYKYMCISTDVIVKTCKSISGYFNSWGKSPPKPRFPVHISPFCNPQLLLWIHSYFEVNLSTLISKIICPAIETGQPLWNNHAE